MRTLRHLSAFSLSVFFLACSATPEDAGGDAAEARGPIGKADAAGSCADDDGGDFCGGKSDGACWCDDLCGSYGDCCSDVVAVCEGEPEPAFCGGIAGIQCADGLECVDNPDDSCDPNNGGSDCGGICVEPTPPPFCGGFAGILCPEGLECVDNPNDGCDPDNGGADCGGICVEPEPTSCSAADCGPGPLAPNVECDDGTIGGPACVDQDGECGWVIIECPEPPPAGPSCEGHCGGASDEGCWCDDLCEGYGDCCDDYAPVCNGGIACGELTCASDEVCVTHVTQLGPQHSCAPLGDACDGEATCGCMGSEVCTGVFDACGETDDGGISCGCPVC